MLGKLLDGRYQIVQPLSTTGGFGQTYIAEDTRRPGNPTCVVKHLKPASNNPNYLETARRLFKSEAETLEQLGNHDQIPRLLAYFEENHEFYLVQQFIVGHPLSHELNPSYPWTENQVIALLNDVLSILAFVHSHGVIHRDIKPDNLIRRDSDGKLVLIDFGAVKQIQTQMAGNYSQLNVTVAVGTPGYMPSEQGLGRPRPSSDIYSLGIIAIQALTGLYPTQLYEDPATGEMLWQHHVQVSPELLFILGKMVRYDYRDRYQSAPEVLQALAQLSSSVPPTQLPNRPPAPVPPTQLPVPATEQNIAPPPTPIRKSSPLPLLVVGAVVAAGVGVAIAYITSTSPSRPGSPQNPGTTPTIALSPTTPVKPNVTPSIEQTAPTASSNEFDRVQFPQPSCGDSPPTNTTSPIEFYPVFIEDTDSNLQFVQSNFCTDAYRTTRKDINIPAIQVASFTDRNRAELFRDFMQRKIGSADVGQPTLYSATPSPETPSSENCITVVFDPESPLNVRSTPDATHENNIIGQLENGRQVSVVAEQDGWLQINAPIVGWISKNRTQQNCQ
ncbi:MAG TPA: protein kinase [Cyanophyceae cyanobacterium]